MDALIENVFKELDGKFCRVKSGRILLEPSVEREVLLVYRQYYGVEVRTKIKNCWYSDEIRNRFRESIENNLDSINKEKSQEISYYTILEHITASFSAIENSYILIAQISYHRIKNIEVKYDTKENHLIQVNITDENNMLTEIRVCSENYNEIQYNRLLND